MTDQAMDRDNVALFARMAEQKRAAGIPMIGEFYPIAPERLSREELHKQVYQACRIIAELGADLIKTFYTHDFKAVTQSCPVPILGLGVYVNPLFAVSSMFSLATFAMLAFFIAVLGVRYSLWCRTTLRAMAATVVTAIVAGGGYLLLFIFVLDGPCRSGELLLLSGCIPYLIFFPNAACADPREFWRDPQSSQLMAAYLCGVVLYTFLLGLLTARGIAKFDRLAGRAHSGGPGIKGSK